MKVFWVILYLALFQVVFAQTSRNHENVQGAGLNPTGATTTYHTIRTASVNQTYADSGCQVIDHLVTLSAVTTFPASSGVYYSLSLTLPSNSEARVGLLLNGVFRTIDNTRNVVSSTPGVALCRGSNACILEYHCFQETATTSMTVRVYTDCDEKVSSNQTYSLSFTQYVDTINVIPSTRNLTISASSETIVGSTSNIGPANFIHFYHDLQLSIPETSEKNVFTIRITNLGTNAVICYNFAHLVGTIGTFPTSTSNTNVACDNVCKAVTTANPTMEIAPCSLTTGCDRTRNLWIGVSPASGTVPALEISLSFDAELIPTATIISTLSYDSFGELHTCRDGVNDPKQYYYLCDNYYFIQLNSSTLSQFDGFYGPYISVNVYGVQNGRVHATISREIIIGENDACSQGCIEDGPIFVCDNEFFVQGCQRERQLHVYPCDWDALTDIWVISVYLEDNNIDDANFPVKYGIEVTIGEINHQTLTVAGIIPPSFGNALENMWDLYQITFSDSDIFLDSKFDAWLYTNFHLASHTFAWMSYTSIGTNEFCDNFVNLCTTVATTTDTKEQISSCGFQFIPCSNTLNAPSMGYRGLLQPSTYIFGVKSAPLFTDNQEYVHSQNSYTILWSFERSRELTNAITHIQNTRRTYGLQHYYIDIPNDYSILRVRVILSNTLFGGETLFYNIDDYAGDCVNCLNSIASCEAQFSYSQEFQNPSQTSASKLWDCELLIQACKVRGKRLHLAVESAQDQNNTPFDINEAVSYTLQVRTELIYSSSVDLIPQPMVTVTGAINSGYNYYNRYLEGLELLENYRFYKVDLSSVDLDNVAVEVKLAFTGLYQEELKWGISNLQSQTFGSPAPNGLFLTNSIKLTVSENGYFIDQIIAESRNVGSLCSPYPERTCTATSNTPLGTDLNIYNNNQEVNGFYSYCTVVLQTCENSISGCRSVSRSLSGAYYIVVQNIADTINFANIENDEFTQQMTSNTIFANQELYWRFLDQTNDVSYSLSVTVIPQDPVPLTDKVPFVVEPFQNVYSHFKFDVPSNLPNNSWLVVNFYPRQDTDMDGMHPVARAAQRNKISYYMHHVPTNGQVVQAGMTSHCYANDLCTEYYTDSESEREVSFTVDPCSLKQGGTYYFSALTPDYNSNSANRYFTVTASIQNIQELITTPTFPHAATLDDEVSNYYRITLTGIANPVLTIEVYNVDARNSGELVFSLSTIEPQSICNCDEPIQGVPLITLANTQSWTTTFYPCNLPATVLYMTFDAQQATALNSIFNYVPVNYVVHAYVQDIPVTSISLTNNTFSGNTTVAYNSYKSFSFTTAAATGSQIVVSVESDSESTGVTVILSRGSLSPDSATCGSICSFTTGGTEDHCVVPPCSVPSTSTTWFLTFYGTRNSFDPLHVSSQMDFFIRVVPPITGVISFPGLGNQTSATVSTSNTIEGAFGSSVYVSNTFGFSGGQFVSFNSPLVYEVSYDACTDFGCGTLTCEMYACSNVDSRVWYFHFNTGATQSGSFTISYDTTITSMGNITPITSLSSNTSSTPISLANNRNYQYYQFTTSLLIGGGYDLDVENSFNANQMVFVNSAFYFPFTGLSTPISVNPHIVLNGATATTCGSSYTFATPQCCVESETITFAIVGSVTSATVKLTPRNYINANTTISTDGTVRNGSITTGIDVYSFNVPAGNHIWISLDYTGNTALDIFINKGEKAGSNQLGTPATLGTTAYYYGANCYDNAFSLSAHCNTNDCDWFIKNCQPCFSTNEGATFFITIGVSNGANDVAIPYELRVVTQTASQAFNTASTTVSFPVSSNIVDATTSAPFAPITYFSYNFPYSTLNDSLNWIPYTQDSSDTMRSRVRFTISNVRVRGGATVTTQPLNVWISLGGFPGPQCGTPVGTLLSASGLCIEANIFDQATATYTCTIESCDLADCRTVFFAVDRATSGTEQYDFDVQATELFNNVTTDVSLFNINAATTGNTQINTTTRVTYLRIKDAITFSAQPFNYFMVTLSTNETTTFSVTSLSAQSCVSSLPGAVCDFSSTSSCVIRPDPCTNQQFYGFDNSNEVFWRIDAGSTANHVFTVAVTALNTAFLSEPTSLQFTGSQYQQVKEIRNFEYHFYSVDISPNTGYANLVVTIDNLCCSATTGGDNSLDIYISFEDTAGNLFDVATPYLIPSDDCEVDSGSLASGGSFTRSINEMCKTLGGRYLITVKSNRNIQEYADLPALYTLTITPSQVTPVILSSDCTWTGTKQHFEILLDGVARGSKILIEVSASESSTLWASASSNPFDTDNCDWDNDGSIYDIESSLCDNSCTLTLYPCFTKESSRIFLYHTSALTKTIKIWHYRPYVNTLVASPKATILTVLSPSFVGNNHYYRVPLASPSRIYLASLKSCSGEALTLSSYLGDLGFSSTDTAFGYDPCNTIGGCFDSQCTTGGTMECGIYNQPDCTYSSLYLAVSDSLQPFSEAEYELTVQTDFIPEAKEFFFDTFTCYDLECYNVFRLSTANRNVSSGRLTITLRNPDLETLNWVVSANSPSFDDDCSGFVSGTCTVASCDLDICASAATDIYVTVFSTSFSHYSTCFTCEQISLSAKVTPLTFTTVTVSGVFYSSGAGQTYYTDTCTGATASSCYLSSGVYLVPGTVAPVSLTVNPTTLSSTFISVTIPTTQNSASFVFNPTNSLVNSFEISNLDSCLVNQPITYAWSTSHVPLCSCTSDGSFTALVASSCDSSATISLPACTTSTVFLTICVGDNVCPTSFNIRAISTPLTQLGSTHQTWTTVSGSSVGCSSSSLTNYYYVDTPIELPLAVSVRNVIGADVTVTLDCDRTCDAEYDPFDGTSSYCVVRPIGDKCSSTISCSDAQSTKRHVIQVTVSPNSNDDFSGYRFEIIAVNAWVTLTSPVTSSVSVGAVHYYRYTHSTANSLVLDLNVISGHSVMFYVYQTPCSSPFYSSSTSQFYSHYQQCAFGHCKVTFPYSSTLPASNDFYIIIDSSQFDVDSIERNLERNENDVEIVKDTQYTLSAITGTSNCQSITNTFSGVQSSFCSSFLSSASNPPAHSSVWKFDNVVMRDDEAECRYKTFVDSFDCPALSPTCLYWLSALSCLHSFPQCDASGFQLPVCSDVCNQVAANCPYFNETIPQDQGIDFNALVRSTYEWSCRSPFYSQSNSTTCISVPPPPPPPPSVSDLINKPQIAETVIPPFNVPVWRTISLYLTESEIDNLLPGGGNDEDEDEGDGGGDGSASITLSQLTSEVRSLLSNDANIALPTILTIFVMIFALF